MRIRRRLSAAHEEQPDAEVPQPRRTRYARPRITERRSWDKDGSYRPDVRGPPSPLLMDLIAEHGDLENEFLPITEAEATRHSGQDQPNAVDASEEVGVRTVTRTVARLSVCSATVR